MQHWKFPYPFVILSDSYIRSLFNMYLKQTPFLYSEKINWLLASHKLKIYLSLTIQITFYQNFVATTRSLSCLFQKVPYIFLVPKTMLLL